MNSIVIPFYRNQESIPELFDELQRVAQDQPDPIEVVCVVDGSPDGCRDLLEERLPKMPFASQLILHSRNFGSFAAIRTGLSAALGDRYAVMAADLQDPPELMFRFFDRLKTGGADVVIGVREDRDDPRLSRFSSNIFWWLFRKLVFSEIPPGGVDVFACNRRFRDQLERMRETETSLVGLIFWLGFRRAEVPYRRRARRHGRSAWTVSRKLRYLTDSVFAFSDLPVRLLIAVGLLGLAVAVALGLLIVGLRLAGEMDEVPGYAATVTTILFFGALNTVGIGIVGAYVWRTFANSQQRPPAVVMSAARYGPSPTRSGS